jgi:cellobiose transport system permease protein
MDRESPSEEQTSTRVLPNGSSEFRIYWNIVLPLTAPTAVAVLPLLVLFVLSSRRLIEGLTAGAVKS